MVFGSVLYWPFLPFTTPFLSTMIMTCFWTSITFLEAFTMVIPCFMDMNNSKSFFIHLPRWYHFSLDVYYGNTMFVNNSKTTFLGTFTMAISCFWEIYYIYTTMFIPCLWTRTMVKLYQTMVIPCFLDIYHQCDTTRFWMSTMGMPCFWTECWFDLHLI